MTLLELQVAHCTLEMVPEEVGALRKLRVLNVEFNNLKVRVHFRLVNQY